MAKELDIEVSLLNLRLARTDISLDQAHKLLMAAKTVPGEVVIEYSRGQRISAVEADVSVEAGADIQAVVQVKLTFKGDMRLPQMRKKVNERLQEVAQRCYAEAVIKEVVEALKNKG